MKETLKWIKEGDAVAARLSQQIENGGVMPALPHHLRGLAAGLGLAAFVVLLAVAYLFRPTLPPPQVLSSMQITNDGQPKGGMATDGTRLYFNSVVGGTSKLYQVSTSGVPVAPLDTQVEDSILLDISPDRSHLLFKSGFGWGTDFPIFAVPVLGGSPRRLNGFSVAGAAWSPDGRQLVYSRRNGLYVANADGTASRQLATFEGVAYGPRWSPDGRKIRFSLGAYNNNLLRRTIWEIAADGKGLHQFLPGWNNPPSECCGGWTSDGNYFFFQSGKGGTENIWVVREGGSFLYKVNQQPVQLTTGPAATLSPLPSLGGKKLFVITTQARGKLVRYDARASEFVPYLNGISATCIDISKDGQWMVYVQFPEYTLWRSKIDGSDKVQLTPPPMMAAIPRWSPDGAQIVFIGLTSDNRFHTYLISADGTGTPQMVPNVAGETTELAPYWSPDGKSFKSLTFSGAPPWLTLHWRTNSIHIMDMRSRKVTTLPGSEGLWVPPWSPNGRYIAAITNDQRRILVYELSTGKWSDLGLNFNTLYHQWSRDSQAIYFLGYLKGKPAAIFRVRLSDYRIELLASLEHFRQAPGFFGDWMGIAPDNSPVLVEDIGLQDIYALELKLP